MAKRVGVLEPEQAQSDSPRLFIKKAYAERLVRQVEAVWIAKGRVIQRLVIRARSFAEQLKKIGFTDGPLGIGNAMPFSRRTDAGQHYHYEIPHAGDIGLWRHLRKRIKVSARSRHSQQFIAEAIRPLPIVLAGSL